MDAPVQLSLLSAGCQPWNFQVVAASGQRCAYCATLSVYIYERSPVTDQFTLHSIVAEHRRGITSLAWHPTDEDIICTTSVDKSIVIWNIQQQALVAQLQSLADSPVTCCFTSDHLVFSTRKGPVQFWRYADKTRGAITVPREYNYTYSNQVTVIKFSPCDLTKLLIGHESGCVSLLQTGKKPERGVDLSPQDDDDNDSDREYESAVISIDWDPHSPDYALVTRYQYGLVMLDTNSMTVLMRYKLPSQAAHIQCVAWVPGASGVFVSGDQQSGILRLWNVSNSEPLESIKIKSTGFHAIATFKKHSTTQNVSNSNAQSSRKLSSSRHKLPAPAVYIFCTFFDGGVGLYDLQHRNWAFIREQGHIETVFDCKFSPQSADRLATASFDGSVKIWDTSQTQLQCVSSSPGNEGVLYQISWAPHDLNCIAVATKTGAFIWDVQRGRITQRYTEHGKGTIVYCIAWNQINSNKILTGGEGNLAIVRNVDGSDVVKFEHPAAVHGCDWCPTNKSMLATCSDDHNIRVFSLPSSNHGVKIVSQPLRLFSGHTSKVFHIHWSPLREGFLASGSDDTTVRVWNYSGESSDSTQQVLKGHTSHVRGLCWSPELVYLLYTGSWDYTIIMWDVRCGARLAVLKDHGGDVYGLSIHPSRPFTLASSSRDSTVRIWSTYHVASLLPVKAMMDCPKERVFATPDSNQNMNKFEVAMVEKSPSLLCGSASSKLNKDQLSNKEMVLAIHKMFQYHIGVNNLLDLIKVATNKPQSSLSEDYGKGIVHVKDLTRYKQSEAAELDMARHTSAGGQIGAPSRQDKLKKAADLYLKLGNIQKYCQLMVENEQWEKALALAPAVSMKFWSSLLTKYTKHLMDADPSEALAYHVARAQPQDLVHYHIQNRAYSDALTAAVACSEGLLVEHQAIQGMQRVDENGDNNNDADRNALLIETVRKLSNHYMDSGYPVLAACCYLSNDMIDECVAVLLRGCMIELAYSVAKLLNCSPDLLTRAAESLSLRCQKLNNWSLAADMLNSVTHTEKALTRLCISCCDSAENEPIRIQAGLGGLSMADDLIADRVKSLLLSSIQTQQLEGIKLALQDLNGAMAEEAFTVTEQFIEVLQCTQSVPCHILTKDPVLLYDLLTISCYVGALLAIQTGYDVIVSYLLELTIRRLQADKTTSVPLKVSDVIQEFRAWNDLKDSRDNDVLETLHRKSNLRSGDRGLLYGEIVTSGYNLPSYSNKSRKSLISGKIIHGSMYTLEDDVSAISLSEAIMWATVNPFSPICCGQTVPIAYKLSLY